MAKSAAKMVVAALLVLAVAAATAEARNIKTTAVAKDDAVVQPQTFPPFDRLGGGFPGAGSSIPGFGSMPGGSSIPAFGGMPGSGGSIGTMPLFGSPGFSGFGGMPGSPAAGSAAEHAKQP
ncbi:MFS18 protein-like [Phragmites australis]|uniref:MFS18 protein-like n=1 Tax=Phragmites australis TaxID=29695 RepID=UPI002D794F96|nr:MFS18 protein-like [Phragmites australis]